MRDRYLLCVVLVGALTAGGANLSAGEESTNEQERIAALIVQLGADEFRTRQRAQKKLAEIGVLAFDALAVAQSNKDAEIAARARFLLDSIRVNLVREIDSAEVRKLLIGYASANEVDRLRRMNALAKLPGALGLEALCRVARFEQSEVLSKRAALYILAQKLKLPAEVEWNRRCNGCSVRPGRPVPRVPPPARRLRASPGPGSGSRSGYRACPPRDQKRWWRSLRCACPKT